MLRKLTKSVCLMLGVIAAQHASAFTLWGPIEAWQTTDLDYSNPAGSTRYYYFFVEPGFDGRENGGPKNFGEGSRLTTPIVTYGFDSTFLSYFGAQGVAAVDSAMQLLNALPTSSAANLNNFLTDGAEQVNYTAQALELLDLKSTVLWMMAEHMGLLGETHVWDLAARAHYDTAACDYEYFVINRNYAPITYDPTPYVNGRLYNYYIWDGCSIGVNVGDSVELPLDTTEVRYSAVATGNGLEFGGYYLNFTQDDVGGLKFLYARTNYAFQALDPESAVGTANGVSGFTGASSSPWQEVATTNEITNVTTTIGPTSTANSNFAGVFGGVEKITFVKVSYDSLLGTNFAPITYGYSIPYVTNSQGSQLAITRTITAPDILFTAANLVSENPLADPTLSRTGTFVVNPYVSPGGGTVASTINPAMLIVLNNVGPIYFNYNPDFLDYQDYA